MNCLIMWSRINTSILRKDEQVVIILPSSRDRLTTRSQAAGSGSQHVDVIVLDTHS